MFGTSFHLWNRFLGMLKLREMWGQGGGKRKRKSRRDFRTEGMAAYKAYKTSTD